MAGRPIIAAVSLLLLAAGIVFEFFVILSGIVSITPFNHSYFLSASTTGIPQSGLISAGLPPSTSRVAWTYFNVAAVDSGSLGAATPPGKAHPAYPFGPQGNFDLGPNQLDSIPPAFRNQNYFFYLSRFAWVFYLIALFFAVIALFTGLLALCSRIGGYISGFTTSIAVFFMTVAAALMTAWTVKARNDFNMYRGGRADAALSRYGYGFTWGAFAAYFIAMILFCVSGAAGGRKETTYKERKGFFGRKTSTRSKDGIRSEYS